MGKSHVNPLAGCLAIVLIVLLVPGLIILRSCSRDSEPAKGVSEIKQTAVTIPYDPKKLLAEAKQEFADKNYGDTIETLKKMEKADLDERQASSLFTRAASSLAKETARRDRDARVEYATTFEHGLLKDGIDATIRTEGAKADLLVIKYILVNRPLVYQMVNDQKQMASWAALGFKKVRFTDGYDSSWTQTID